MRNYKSVVSYGTRELTAKERLRVKDANNSVSLDEETKEGAVIIDFRDYFIIDVENEMADNQTYTFYVVEDVNGYLYRTGSEYFASALIDIYSELKGEDFSIKVYRKPSKKNKDKSFLTCSVY